LSKNGEDELKDICQKNGEDELKDICQKNGEDELKDICQKIERMNYYHFERNFRFFKKKFY
jgi:hypothetical protein